MSGLNKSQQFKPHSNANSPRPAQWPQNSVQPLDGLSVRAAPTMPHYFDIFSGTSFGSIYDMAYLYLSKEV